MIIYPIIDLSHAFVPCASSKCTSCYVLACFFLPMVTPKKNRLTSTRHTQAQSRDVSVVSKDLCEDLGISRISNISPVSHIPDARITCTHTREVGFVSLRPIQIFQTLHLEEEKEALCSVKNMRLDPSVVLGTGLDMDIAATSQSVRKVGMTPPDRCACH